jgi:pyridoxal/pyridoxine/pyridoxamine kinase
MIWRRARGLPGVGGRGDGRNDLVQVAGDCLHEWKAIDRALDCRAVNTGYLGERARRSAAVKNV